MFLSRLMQLFTNPVRILYMLPGILIGLTVHEWAHAYAAYRLGDPTAKNLGRMTLNPLAHFDPIGILCLLIVGFGWAKPVPVNPRNFKNFKRDDIIVSLAGVAMNLLVAFVFTLVFRAGQALGLAGNQAFASIMRDGIVGINLSLMIFNLIPIYPLDGSHVLESLLVRKFPRFFMFMRRYGQWILIALLFLGVISTVLGTAVNGIFSGFYWLASRLIPIAPIV